MNTYYSKQLASGILPAGMPQWAIYETTDAGAECIALAYDEAMAERITTALLQTPTRDSTHEHQHTHSNQTSA